MLQDVMKVVNDMEADGVIGRYAIGGAVAATFYLQPFATEDVDIFVTLSASPGSVLISLTPIYEYLAEKGAVVEKEHLVLGTWPMQFLPASTPLLAEALGEAVTTFIAGIPVRVMTAEHLVAIALETGRAKDYARILQFLEQNAVNHERLGGVLERYGLEAKWNEFKRRFLKES